MTTTTTILDNEESTNNNKAVGLVVIFERTGKAKRDKRQKKSNKQAKRTSFIFAIKKKHLIYKMILFFRYFFASFSLLYFLIIYIMLRVCPFDCVVCARFSKRVHAKRFIRQAHIHTKISPLCAFKKISSAILKFLSF